MGMFFGYGLFKSGGKKRCTICGCHMYSDSDSDICEICLDELYASDPGEPEEDEEFLYPELLITTSGPVRDAFDKIVENRLAELRQLGEEVDK